MNLQLKNKISESLSSVLPIVGIVLCLSVTILPLDGGLMVLFLMGALLLIVGMGFFTLGADMAMLPMGEGLGIVLSRSKKIWVSVVISFFVGLLITVAEPDLVVLATQIPSIPNYVLIFSVAVGVGLFLVIALLRIFFRIKLSHLLIAFYSLVFVLVIFTPNTFIPVAFDSGGVTTGPMTVPFIMSLGVGMAAIRSDKNSSDDSFGLVALCSIGPILSVLILGLFYNPSAAVTETVLPSVTTTKEAFELFLTALPHYAKEVLQALFPIGLLFLLFQWKTKRFRRHQLLKILCGFLYTYLGLVLFLTGVNIGFMPVGHLIGSELAGGALPYLLIPIGMVVGYFIVSAEPAVHVLEKQVEEVSNGAITQQAIGRGLSIGVSISVGIAMLRILTGISILWFLVPGYLLSIVLSFFVPSIYTGIAFDSGGVASGPMTATFLLPLAMGACEAMGGNLLTDAFGIVAMVAMTPLITIQLLGFHSMAKRKLAHKAVAHQLSQIQDSILYYD